MVHTDFYNADAMRRRSEVKRSILNMSGLLRRDIENLESEIRYFPPYSSRMRQYILQILERTLLLTENLNFLTGDKYQFLYAAHQQVENAVRAYFKSLESREGSVLVVSPAEADTVDEKLIGDKSAKLFNLKKNFPGNVSPGFVVTTAAYRLFIDENELEEKIHTLLKDLDVIANRDLFHIRTRAIRKLMEEAAVPERITAEIREWSEKTAGRDSRWAVRSSGIGEGGRATFAGQFDSFLNVAGDSLPDAYRKVIASRFTDRAVYYRLAGGFSETDTPMAVLFMPMIDARSAGVLYTSDPGDSSSDRMILNSVWGLAADLLSGRADPDTFIVSRSAPGRIIKSYVAEKQTAVVPGADGLTGKEQLATARSGAPSLSENEISDLAQLGLAIEKHLGAPQDIEWVVDRQNKYWIVQSRCLLLPRRRDRSGGRPEQAELLTEGGDTIFPGWTTGPVFTPGSDAALIETPSGAILVVKKLHSGIVEVLPYLAGLIAEQSDHTGRIASRVQEYGLPCLFGVDNATEKLPPGTHIVLDAAHRSVFAASAPETDDAPDARGDNDGFSSVPGTLSELIFKSKHTDPVDLSSESAQGVSLYDIVRFVHGKAAKFNPVSGRDQG